MTRPTVLAKRIGLWGVFAAQTHGYIRIYPRSRYMGSISQGAIRGSKNISPSLIVISLKTSLHGAFES